METKCKTNLNEIFKMGSTMERIEKISYEFENLFSVAWKKFLGKEHEKIISQ
jgi:hypothetical protein